MNGKRLKLLILALDGLDPDLLTRWWGQLPNIASLAECGRFRRLQSTVPPMTFPAWSTFLTGANPGKHGIFDFTERIPGKMGVRFVNATRRRLPTFLKLLSDAGVRVGSVGIPTTYPPEPLSGFLISGFDTPLPSRADRSFMQPPGLADEIKREFGGYRFGDFNESRIGRRWHRRVLEKLLEGIRRKVGLFRYLWDRYPVEVFVLYMGETDTVGHHFWALNDPHSPRFVEADDDAVRDAVRHVYRAADDAVGEVCRACNPETVMIVSDHGMGGTSDRMLYLNRFLEEKGFLRFSASDSGAAFVGKLKTFGMQRLPYRWQQWVFHFADGKIASDLESRQRFGAIDWRRTSVYSEELNYFPSFWLNIEGRDPYGIVSLEDADSLIKRLVRELSSWVDPESGVPVVKKVHRREDLYRGPEIGSAPDIILELNQPDGYSYALGRSTSPSAARSWRKLRKDEYLGFKGGTMNGSHRPFGTLVMKTDGGTLVTPERPALADIAPTVLDLFGFPKPDWMDGTSLFGGRQAVMRHFPGVVVEKPYSRTEEEHLRKQLTNLGYLD